MAKRRKNLFDNMFDRLDDVSRDFRKAGRRTFKSKKRKKGSARKWARRNSEQLDALTEQMALLVRHLSSSSDTSREPTRSTK
ncbi:hypothetical protein [Saccharothrix australiensis]|uniref:Uncharacterized protein n=1 Tax=Saccharothrix australiensis TaxID=2072 RepID=A0A495VZZ5_9PSEU|nr:hypothetical protein [Saccharothrix australiensis]RKT54450.1 hypothetical protein C8E97_3072 [Saccharothrix australiensis]